MVLPECPRIKCEAKKVERANDGGVETHCGLRNVCAKTPSHNLREAK